MASTVTTISFFASLGSLPFNACVLPVPWTFLTPYLRANSHQCNTHNREPSIWWKRPIQTAIPSCVWMSNPTVSDPSWVLGHSLAFHSSVSSNTQSLFVWCIPCRIRGICQNDKQQGFFHTQVWVKTMEQSRSNETEIKCETEQVSNAGLI